MCGHLYSPGDQRGPYVHFPYALDNGAYSCWTKRTNTFHDDKWALKEPQWRKLVAWAHAEEQKPLWGIVPDVPGNGARTVERWATHSGWLVQCGIPLAVAVQDGMTVEMVLALSPAPEVICVGGTDEFKWGTLDMWLAAFPRVHVLRCNAPTKFDEMAAKGVESTDGTGMNRGDPKQTRGVIEWLYRNRRSNPGYPAVPDYLFCRSQRDKQTLLPLT
jgi:hypothetical protein